MIEACTACARGDCAGQCLQLLVSAIYNVISPLASVTVRKRARQACGFIRFWTRSMRRRQMHPNEIAPGPA
eukprot:14738169-Alexandrium_andersonii.AAC.1